MLIFMQTVFLALSVCTTTTSTTAPPRLRLRRHSHPRLRLRHRRHPRLRLRLRRHHHDYDHDSTTMTTSMTTTAPPRLRLRQHSHPRLRLRLRRHHQTLMSDEAAGKTTGSRRFSVIHDGWPNMAQNLTRTAGSRRIAMRSWNVQLKAWAELDSRPVPLWPTTPVTITDTMTITSGNTNSRYHDDNYHE